MWGVFVSNIISRDMTSIASSSSPTSYYYWHYRGRRVLLLQGKTLMWRTGVVHCDKIDYLLFGLQGIHVVYHMLSAWTSLTNMSFPTPKLEAEAWTCHDLLASQKDLEIVYQAAHYDTYTCAVRLFLALGVPYEIWHTLSQSWQKRVNYGWSMPCQRQFTIPILWCLA